MHITDRTCMYVCKSHDRKFAGRRNSANKCRYLEMEMDLQETRSIESVRMIERRDSPVFLSLWPYVKGIAYFQSM